MHEGRLQPAKHHVIYLIDKLGRVIGWPSRPSAPYPTRKGRWHLSRFYTADACEAGEPERDLRLALDGGLELEAWRVREDGTRFWARVVMSPYGDDIGSLLGVVLVMSPLGDQAAGTQRWTLPPKFDRRKR
jgi:hypothetical protein